jgi:hypothetical protein
MVLFMTIEFGSAQFFKLLELYVPLMMATKRA